ncbi:MAG: glycosyltransferase, partial [Chloroflexi bacterium]|nr:glycosyltransferase [Chloroflexota bacterium]
MKIAYDSSSLLVAPFAGVGNYTFQLLAHLQRSNGEHTYHLLSHRALGRGIGLTGHPHTQRVPAHFPNRLLWMQCVLPSVLRALQPAVAHFPNFVAPLMSDQNIVVTIHDLGLLRSPQLFTRRQRMLMRPFIIPSMQRARAIIVMS